MKRFSPTLLCNIFLILFLAALCIAAPLPPSGRPKELIILHGHKDLALDFAFSPDSQILASAGRSDSTTRIWDLASGKTTLILKGHSSIPPFGIEAMISAVAFSPDGKTIATGANDNQVLLWDVTSGKQTATVKVRPRVKSLTFSPDGKTLVINGGRTLVWDLEKGKELANVNVDDHLKAEVIAYTTKGKLMVLGRNSDRKSFNLWDVEKNRKTATFAGHEGGTTHIGMSPDGQIVGSAGLDQKVRLWDVDSGRNTRTMADFPGRICRLAFSPDGKILACGYLWQGEDGLKPRRGAVRLYDTATGKLLATLRGNPGPISPLVFSPDGRLLASGSVTNDYSITVWKLPVRYAKEKDQKEMDP